MPRTHVTTPGEMLDLIVYRAYAGAGSPAVEAVLEANRAIGLSEHPPALPGGLVIVLPDLAPATTAKPLESLWD